MKRAFENVAFALIGAILASFAMAAHEIANRQDGICIPLYDQTGLECLRCEPE